MTQIDMSLTIPSLNQRNGKTNLGETIFIPSTLSSREIISMKKAHGASGTAIAISAGDATDGENKNTEFQFAGILFCASYNKCKKGTLTNIDQLKMVMERAIIASGATIISMIDHVFKSSDPNKVGYTSAYILSESHASISYLSRSGFMFCRFVYMWYYMSI